MTDTVTNATIMDVFYIQLNPDNSRVRVIGIELYFTKVSIWKQTVNFNWIYNFLQKVFLWSYTCGYECYQSVNHYLGGLILQADDT